eukprot:6804314-Prymnesium_polylepis.1
MKHLINPPIRTTQTTLQLCTCRRDAKDKKKRPIRWRKRYEGPNKGNDLNKGICQQEDMTNANGQ